ncbi:hypothetical protein ASF41_21990 [Methylobacterium sp. Leaf111]|nr:hypothetical protein ASF41_21990 [Methylobacterium sp. Leaf111]
MSSAGDINGDGFDDLIVGAWTADPNSLRDAGSSYVVFGHADDFSPTLALSSLNGSNGFRLDGAAVNSSSGDSVSSAGDVNGDGFDDLIVGARFAAPNGSFSGSSYVVFGHAGGFSSTVALSSLNGSTGFRLDGAAYGDRSGKTVSSAGDVNGDGFDDLIVGAYGVDANGLGDAGSSYVVFGGPANALPTVSVADASIVEGDAGTSALSFTLTLSQARSQPVTVAYATSNGTALSGSDYTATSGSFTFAPGTTTGSISVQVIGDTRLEGDEKFSLVLSSPSGAVLDRSTATGTITNDDTAPVYEISVDPASVLEGNAGTGNTVTYTVSRTGDTSQAGTVMVDLSGTATSGSDYTVAGLTTDSAVLFAAGDITATFTVTSTPDTLVEANETVLATLSTITAGGTLGAAFSAEATITNDDVRSYAIAVSPATVAEASAGVGNTLTYTVSRSQAGVAASVAIDLSGSAGSSDYTTSLQDGHISFGADDLSVSFMVTTTPDTLSEGDETVVATLTAPAGSVVVGPAAVTGTITNTPPATGGAQTIIGTANADTLTGTSGNDTLDGLGGNDKLDGGLGADTMNGGAGNDTYTVDNAGDVVVELASQGSDRVISSVTYTLTDNVENLTLFKSAAINGTGNDLANVLVGNASANVLDGKLGADTLTGGAGADTFALSTALGAGNVDRIADFVVGEDTIRLSASVFSALASGSLAASAFKELSTGTLDGDDRILYNKGTGTLSYDADGNGSAFTAVQFATVSINTALTAADFRVGASVAGGATDGPDTLIGTDGNDLLDGKAGADTMSGGLGDDVYVVDNAGDVVTEQVDQGTDTVRTSLTSYVLTANVEKLAFTGTSAFTGTGNALANTIMGNAGADKLDGKAGADTLIGGAGSDTYYVDNAGDVVVELAGQGTDRVIAQVSYTLSANVENLTLSTSAALSGTGNALANTVVGNGGANVLNGKGGADTLTGGLGNDTFVFQRGETSGDKVLDFSGAGGDRLEFRGFGTNATLTQEGSSDFYMITAGAGGASETFQLVGVKNLDLAAGSNDFLLVA